MWYVVCNLPVSGSNTHDCLTGIDFNAVWFTLGHKSLCYFLLVGPSWLPLLFIVLPDWGESRDFSAPRPPCGLRDGALMFGLEFPGWHFLPTRPNKWGVELWCPCVLTAALPPNNPPPHGTFTPHGYTLIPHAYDLFCMVGFSPVEITTSKLD